MHIQSHANTAVKGYFEATSDDIYSLFTHPNRDLLDYVVFKNYVNIGDPRASLSVYNRTTVPMFRIGAKSVVRHGDTFDWKIGKDLVKAKLFTKGVKLANDIKKNYDKVILDIRRRLGQYKNSLNVPLDYFDSMSNHDYTELESRLDFCLCDSTSRAQFYTPIDCNYTFEPFTVDTVIEDIAYLIKDELLFKKHITAMDKVKIEDFIQDFKTDLKDRVLNRRKVVKHGVRKVTRDCLVFKVTSKKHPDDENDLKEAARQLRKKLRLRWAAFVKSVCDEASRMLDYGMFRLPASWEKGAANCGK